jgi:hypothetical protein
MHIIFKDVQIHTIKINSKKDFQICFNKLIFVAFEVLTAVVIKSIMFWDIPLCSLLKVHLEDGVDMFL